VEQEMMGWQWHQLDHMQIICTSLQTDNHASTSPLHNNLPLLFTQYAKLILKENLQLSYDVQMKPVGQHIIGAHFSLKTT